MPLSPEDIARLKSEIEEKEQTKALQKFVKLRSELIAKKIVTVSTGKSFDADEQSMNRLGQAVIKHLNNPDNHVVRWSTADVGTGVMVDCTKAEIVEAHGLAADYFESVWDINNPNPQ